MSAGKCTCPFCAIDGSLWSQESCLEWSLWQLQQHEAAHRSAIMWRGTDVTECEGHKENAVCGRENDPNCGTLCSSSDCQIVNLMALGSVPGSHFLTSI